MAFSFLSPVRQHRNSARRYTPSPPRAHHCRSTSHHIIHPPRAWVRNIVPRCAGANSRTGHQKENAIQSDGVFLLVARTPTSKQRVPIHSVSPKSSPLSLNIPSHHTSPARMGSHTPRGLSLGAYLRRRRNSRIKLFCTDDVGAFSFCRRAFLTKIEPTSCKFCRTVLHLTYLLFL